ncbi:TELO2-interacting protein 1 homolog [Anopheles nili]|uniref:TELO2-interacting protein 1 homolog n=1 Tax=Anopheles nili TaxID=185578 RepID=UPI00237B2CC4|nr:TELO2-interacting protein 1 homolog [Anopheles nili]
MADIPHIFTTIKPLIEKVIKQPTRKNITKLNEHLQKADDHGVQMFQNVFLQQLIIIVDGISGINQLELKTYVLECIITILKKSRVTKALVLQTTLLVSLKLIYDKTSGSILPGLSEEYKLAVLKVLSLITRRIESGLVESVYVKENQTMLSQAIFVCVCILHTDRARNLRFQAVDTILSLLQVHDDFDFNDAVLRCQVADLLFIILPKLLVTFVSIINGDEKQGSAVFRIAIKALGRTLNLFFEDYSKEAMSEDFDVERFQKLAKSMTGDKKKANILGMGLNQHDKIKYYNETLRSREWLLEAEKKVEQILYLIIHLRGHDEELIRWEFAKMNCELLRNGSYNMPSCSVHYLQTVISMCHDESQRIRDICQKCRNTILSSSISFVGIRMDEHFYDTLNKLPRIIYRGEEREQIANFRLVTGYLKFFTESQLTNVFSAQSTIEQFITVLLVGSELQSVEELIRREYTSYRFEYEEGFRTQKEKNESRWIVMKNLRSPRAKEAFLDLFRALQSHEQAVNTVLMYILEDFYSSKLNSNGYLFILSELIPNFPEIKFSNMEPVKMLLSEVLQTQHWFLELDENENIADQKFNALHICLVVRAISKIARLMKEHFRLFLYDALRILLQCCGSTLNCINESTELALDAVAEALGMSSIEQLIHSNLDYISQQVTRCLRRTEHFRDGMCILEAVLRFVPYETSDVLESTVTPIVMNILDSYSQYGARNSIVCLRVLQIFIHSIRLRYQEPPEVQDGATNKKAIKNLSEQIDRLQELLQREVGNEQDFLEELNTPFKKDGNNEQQNDIEEESNENEEISKELPSHIKIVLRILTVNFKYLASSDDAARIVSLSTLNEGIYILQHHENELLPLVHQIWFNFSERFSDRHPAVISNAFDLLVTLARLSKDFIRKRSLSDVLPKIYKFMLDHWDTDASAHQVYKLQCKFFAHIDELVRNLSFDEREMDQVLEVVRLYLQKAERRELKKLAAECMNRMRSINSLAVFLKCSKFG